MISGDTPRETLATLFWTRLYTSREAEFLDLSMDEARLGLEYQGADHAKLRQMRANGEEDRAALRQPAQCLPLDTKPQRFAGIVVGDRRGCRVVRPSKQRRIVVDRPIGAPDRRVG